MSKMPTNKERDAGIQRFLDNCPDSCNPTPDEQQMIPIGCDDAICISWSKPGCGFGGLVFYFNKDRELRCDNEGMSKEFIKDRLCKMVDDAELDG